MITNIKILYIILIFNIYCFAQITNELISQEQFLEFDKLTVNEGLSQNLVMFISQDKQGFLWFGTADGLLRFDGIDINKINNIRGLNKPPVYYYSCLLNDDSTFWFSTELGLMLYNPILNSTKMFPLPSFLNNPGKSNIIRNLTKINDEIIFFELTGMGLVSFNTKSKEFNMLHTVNSGEIKLFGDIAKVIPINNKIFVVTLNEILMYSIKEQKFYLLAEFPKGITVNCVYNDSNNKLLIGTNKGIFSFNLFSDATVAVNKSPVKLTFPKNNDININLENITSLYKDSKDIFWIGTDNGLARFDELSNIILYYSYNPLVSSSILPGSIIILYEDKSENLWISVLNQGLCKLSLKNKRFYTIKNEPGFPKQLVTDINSNIHVDKNDKLWLSGSGITSIDFNNNKTTLYKTGKNNFPKNVKRIYTVNDSSLIVLATINSNHKRRIFIYDKNLNNRKELLVNNKIIDDVNNIYLRKSNNFLICATKDSIFEINPFNNKFIKSHFIFNKYNFVPTIAFVDFITEDSGNNLWIGTNFGLLNIIDSLNTFNFYSDTTFSTAILSSSVITSLAFSDNENLWVGTISGLNKLNIKSNVVKTYYNKDGLPNEKIWSLLIDNKKRVWATSNSGIFRLEELPNNKSAIRSFTIEDGLPSNEFVIAASAKDSKGNFYFSSVSGIIYFHPDSIKDYKNNFPIILTDLKYYGESDTSIYGISYISNFNIPYNKKIFSLRYSVLDYTSPHRNIYQYKLSGYDENWINAGKRREIFFTNLDPGEYKLFIKSANSDLVWSENPLILNFEIIPPFWMTWWFRGFIILGIVIFIGFIIRNYELKKIRKQIEELKQQKAIEAERSRISRDMHDEIGSSLTQIAIMSELAVRESTDKKEINLKLQNISEKSREVIDSIGEIIWAMNPKNDTLENLIWYVREYTSRFMEAAFVSVVFNIPNEIPIIKLSAEIRRNIFLIIKEILNNIIKHSGATKTELSFIIKNNIYELIINDNGKGFDINSNRKFGNGIVNIKKRVEDCNAEFDLNSTVNKGTTFRIQFKINNHQYL